MRGEAEPEGDVASLSPFLALCPGRSAREAGRTSSGELGCSRVPEDSCPLRCALSSPSSCRSSFPLPSAASSFPPPPQPLFEGACRAPSCSSLSSFYPEGEGVGGELGCRFMLLACPLPGGGLLGRRWRLILHGSRGWESFDQQHSVHLGPRL